jgi:O-antigen/teichoic acid export membrane protein
LLPEACRSVARVLHTSSARAGVARALVLPVASIAAVSTAHIELVSLGSAGFGLLTLLLTLTLLLPFADLGVGAAVTNAVSGTEAAARAQQVVAASLRLLALTGGAIVALAAVVSAMGLWNQITGVSHTEAPSLGRDMLFVMALFGVGLPVSLGGRILLGLNRYPLFLLAQGVVPFATLGVVYRYRESTALTPFLLAPFASQLLVSLAVLGLALYFLGLRPRQLWASLRTSSPQTNRQIRRTALPMLLITIGLPIALQTDRLVLSHVSTRDALSHYAIVALLYAPAWSVISSAGLTLWPRFAAMDSNSQESLLAYGRMFRAFLAVGAAGAVTFVLLGPLVTRLWAGSTGGSLALWCAFALLLLVQSTHLPGGMFLTQPAGLRFQAICVTAMCAVNLPLSIVLARLIGAPGPVLASTGTILSLQLVTARLRILRTAGVSESDGARPFPSSRPITSGDGM